jgi:starch phosphorylase
VDVWLNNPRRPLEASGTSGEKAAMNGVLNLSILDGWWAEAFDGKNGFAIGVGEQHVDEGVQDPRDAGDLYRVLEEQVVPLFYDRDADGLPREWVMRMKRTIRTLAMDYVRSCYLPAAGALSASIP